MQLFLNTWACGNTAFVNGSGSAGFTWDNFPQSLRPRALAVADTDGDGLLDVFVGGWGGVSRVFLNNGGDAHRHMPLPPSPSPLTIACLAPACPSHTAA